MFVFDDFDWQEFDEEELRIRQEQKRREDELKRNSMKHFIKYTIGRNININMKINQLK